MTRKIIILTVFAAAVLFFYRNTGSPLLSSHRYASFSPDKKYRADVYSDPMYGAMPGGGGAGSRSATILVRNEWGWIVGSNAGCHLFMDDVKIEWDGENNSLEIAPARSIDLRTGKCAQ